MKRITLSTSSSSLGHLNIPHRVEIVPMHLLINNVGFVDGVNITPSTFHRIMKTSPNTIARTSPPSEKEMLDIFHRLHEQGYQEVFVCSISSQFSKTYEIFNFAKHQFSNYMDIHVYDTKTLNIAEGSLAYEADCLMQEGWAMADIATHLDDLRSRNLFFFTLSDLSFIIRNKKLSGASGFIANLFDIKPIMQINQQGKIVPYKKVRKIEQSLRQMVESIDRHIGNHEAFFYVADGGFEEVRQLFVQILQNEFGLKNPPIIPVSTISMANHGPTGIAIGAFYGKLPRIVQHLHTL